MNHGVVQRWLRQVVGPYDDPDRVYADVDRTLIANSSLSPKTEVYTYDDGRSQLLLVLTGTVPMQYRAATYNIPVAFWIPRSYPKQHPLAYVTPTNDMLVRKGRHVDLSGRIGGEYLERWQRKWEGCNLLELVQDCQSIFGQEPPVYAKPKDPIANAQIRTGSASPRASTSAMSPVQNVQQSPMDPRERAPPSRPGQDQSPASMLAGPPRRPPKLHQSSGTFDEGRRFSNGADYAASTNSPSFNPQNRYATSPAGPHSPMMNSEYGQRYTAEPGAMRPREFQGQPEQTGRQASWSGYNGSSSQLPFHVNGPSGLSHRAASYSSTTSSNETARQNKPESNAAPPIPPLPYSHQQSHPYGQPIASQHDPSNRHSYDPSQRGPTVGNAAPAPAPPRPPNPELLYMHNLLYNKIQARIHHLRTTSEQSQEQMKLLSDDLDRGEMAVKDEMARLEAVRDICRSTGDQLEQTVEAAKQRIAELHAREEPDIDGVLSATSLVGNQLIELVAEDNAIEDTLYHLGRALNSEVLDLDRFLKQTRFLAREQFMRRALAQKISQGMGWESIP